MLTRIGPLGAAGRGSGVGFATGGLTITALSKTSGPGPGPSVEGIALGGGVSRIAGPAETGARSRAAITGLEMSGGCEKEGAAVLAVD